MNYLRIVFLSYYPVYKCESAAQWFESASFYHGYLEQLAELAEVHDIAIMKFSATVERNNVRYHFLHKKRWEGTFPFSINRYIKRLAPDIVVVHGFLFPLQVMMLKTILKTSAKIILQHHAELPFTGRRSLLFRTASGSADAYFFATRSMGIEWQQHKLIPANKPIIQIPEASSVFSLRSNVVKDARMFLWVGRLNLNKDPITLIKAFHRYCNHVQDARLYMIFKTNDLLSNVAEFIAENKLEKNIILVGEVPHSEMQLWFERSSFIVCSSHYEGCNISVIEGMSCGCIPIVTKIPSFELHTNNGQIGLQFTPGDENELLHCLMQTKDLNTDAERRNVVDHFQHELSFKAIAQKMYNAFIKLENSNS